MSDAPRGPVVTGNRWTEVTDPVPDGVRISVVVTHFEQPRQLARVLSALEQQTWPAELIEVIVADDGSRRAPDVPAGVRLVRQDDQGFRAAAARNLGARHASGDVLVFLDADTAPEPDFLTRLVRLPALLDEAVVVGRRRHVDVATGTVLSEPDWLRDAYVRTGDLVEADETSFRFVISAVLACRRWFFELVGGFDETFTTYGGEDWEWAHRAWTHGALLAHEPGAVAWHDGPDQAGRRDVGCRAEAARQLAETLASGARIPVPGVAPVGLLLGPADPVVTVGRRLAPDALVLSLDSLFAALPRARVLLHEHHLPLLAADPRVLPLGRGPAHEHPAARSAWRRLHVHAGVTGPATAWAPGGELLCGPGAPGRVTDATPAGRPLLTWRSLRAERRAARWSRDDLDAAYTRTSDLQVLGGDVTVAARWGGWA